MTSIDTTKPVGANPPRPCMSVVLAADAWDRIEPVVRALGEAPDAPQVELVLVLPHGEETAVEEAGLHGLGDVRTVTVTAVPPLARARAAGVEAATAPYVFVGETHSFAAPGMVAAMVTAHDPDWGVVVPRFENANPDGATSWAGFLIGYARWAAGRPGGAIDDAPMLNVSYRRSFLVSLGERLPALLTEGEDMHAALLAGGQRLRFEPAARIAHANIPRLGPWLHQRFLAGRAIAGRRSARWSRRHRLAYAIGSPLIPVVVLTRSRRGIAGTLRRDHLPAATIPTLVLGSLAAAFGELLGYLTGEGARSRHRYDVYELR